MQGLQTVPCPATGCPDAFDCDACLAGHLRRRHDVAYGEVFGQAQLGLIDLCTRHAGLTGDPLRELPT